MDGEHHHPPQRHSDGQGGDSGPSRDHLAGCGPSCVPLGENPHHWAGQHHREGGGIDTGDGEDDESEQGRVPPAAAAHTVNCEKSEPAQRCPRKQHQRGAAHIGEHIGRELVHEGCDQGAGGGETEHPGQALHPPAAEEQDGGDPQSVGNPVGKSELLACPEPGARGPKVGEHLVGYPASELAGVPRLRRTAHEAPGIEVEVELGVGRHATRRGEQGR